MSTITDIIASANTAISIGDVFESEGVRIEVVDISPLGDVIWFDDNAMHMITPSLDRIGFCKLVAGMQRAPKAIRS